MRDRAEGGHGRAVEDDLGQALLVHRHLDRLAGVELLEDGAHGGVVEVVGHVGDRPARPRLDAVAPGLEGGLLAEVGGVDVAVVDRAGPQRVGLGVGRGERQEVDGLDVGLAAAVVLGVGGEPDLARGGEGGEGVRAADRLPERVARVAGDVLGGLVEVGPHLLGAGRGAVLVGDGGGVARPVPDVLRHGADHAQLVGEHPLLVVRLVEGEGEVRVVDGLE